MPGDSSLQDSCSLRTLMAKSSVKLEPVLSQPCATVLAHEEEEDATILRPGRTGRDARVVDAAPVLCSVCVG